MVNDNLTSWINGLCIFYNVYGLLFACHMVSGLFRANVGKGYFHYVTRLFCIPKVKLCRIRRFHAIN